LHLNRAGITVHLRSGRSDQEGITQIFSIEGKVAMPEKLQYPTFLQSYLLIESSLIQPSQVIKEAEHLQRLQEGS
jgi:hypothetical protein